MDLRPDTCTGTHAGNTLMTTWTWDTAPNGIGRVHEVTSPDAIKTYGYNERGQTESVTLGVNGEAFATRFSYDEASLLKSAAMMHLEHAEIRNGVDLPAP